MNTQVVTKQIDDKSKYLELKIIFKKIYSDEKPKNKKEIWLNLIENKKLWIDSIEKVIRLNTNLCYLLQNDQDIRKINLPLYKLHYIFDQDFYYPNNNAEKGINKLFDLINITYGDLEKLLQELKYVCNIILFYDNNKDKIIINEYNYLKKISLPLKGYEELRINLITILKKFKQIDIIIANPQIYKDFLKEINSFKNRYIKRYIIEHKKFQDDIDYFNNKLHNLAEYRALKNLSNITNIRVAYNLKTIKKYLDSFFPKKCYNCHLYNYLKEHPRCNCGFNCGETFVIPPFKKIKPMLIKGIHEYIKELQNSFQYNRLINKHIENHPESPLKKLLNLDIKELNNNLEIFNKELINEINSSLIYTYTINISIKNVLSEMKGTYNLREKNIIANKIKNIINKKINNKLEDIKKLNEENKIIINIIK